MMNHLSCGGDKLIKRLIIASIINVVLVYYVYNLNQDSETALSDTFFIISLFNFLISLSSTLGKRHGSLGFTPNWLSFTTVMSFVIAKENIKQHHRNRKPFRDYGRFNSRLLVYGVIGILFLITSFIFLYIK